MNKIRRVELTVLAFFIIYLAAPLVAGVLGTRDPRGPKIYPARYHEAMHAIGNRGQKKIPFTERVWFYGMVGPTLQENAPRKTARSR
jgi:hypothetical protein